MTFSFKTSLFLAFLAGVLLVFAFAPTHFLVCDLICPAALYALVIRQTTSKYAAGVGFSFGLGFFGVGISWVFVSIYVFGGTSAILAGFITLLFVMVLAVFFALIAFLLQKFFPRPTFTKALLVYPALWALAEALRSWLLSGFPWLILGHSLAGSLFSGFAPLVGAYGSSFFIVMISSLFLFAVVPSFESGQIRSWKSSNFALLVFLIFLAAAYALHVVDWTKPEGQPLSVSLAQGNIQQSLRWDPEEVNHIMTTYENLTQNHFQSNLIVWPEAAIPLTPEEARPLLENLQKQLAPTKSALLTGMPIAQGLGYTNAVIGVGNAKGVYEKRHLVPFGEYVPFERYLRGLIQFFNLPMSNMFAGDMQQALMQVANLPVGVYICYEVAYDAIVRSDLPAAKLLVTVSDDAWFGDSLAPAQHLQIGQFQALATGRPMLFVGNNGITAIIDAKGRILRRLPQFAPGVLEGQVQPYTGSTPWVRLGDAPWVVVMLVTVLFCGRRR